MKTFNEYIAESEESLMKKIKAKQDALGLARERRRGKAQSRLQSEREIKLSSQISELMQQLHMLKNK
jgi:hypothetical protein